jgi:hypothetical protein
MDYGKAKVILKKLSTLMDSFESLGEPISEIESEMLHKYVDKLSQLIPSEGEFEDSVEKHKEKPVKLKLDAQVSVEEKQEAQEPSPPEEAKPKTKITQKESSKQNVETEELCKDVKEEKVKVEEKLEPVKEAQPKKEVASEKVKKKRVLVANEEDDDSEGDTSDLWSPVEIKELSHKLSFSPIKNIFKAISINERILLQNELFGGDSKDFKETLDHLESFKNFEDAANYLKSGVAKEHKWEDSKKIKKANNFMKIVQRRFL